MKKLIVLFAVLFVWFFSLGATNYIYVGASSAGNASGDSWVNQMGRAEWETDLEAPCSADDVYFVKGGTYTLSEDLDMTAIDGTAAAPITIIGVLSTTTNEGAAIVVSDYATGADRPDIVCAANQFGMGDYWVVKNLDFTTDHASGIQVSLCCIVEKCSVVGTGARGFFGQSSYNVFIDCDAKSTSDKAFDVSTANELIRCYAYDSPKGVLCGSNGLDIRFCKIDTCQTGIDINTRSYVRICDNTIWGSSTVGITGTSPTCILILSNIIQGCAKGIEISVTPSPSNYADYNIWSNNTDDIVDTDITMGPHSTDTATLQVDTTNGCLLSSSVVAIDGGLQITSTGDDDKINTGADQHDNASGGRSAGANLGGVLQE